MRMYVPCHLKIRVTADIPSSCNRLRCEMPKLSITYVCNIRTYVTTS